MKYLVIALLLIVPTTVSADEVTYRVRVRPVVRVERPFLKRSVTRKVERNGVKVERSVSR
jgi:hypothetical protein